MTIAHKEKLRRYPATRRATPTHIIFPPQYLESKESQPPMNESFQQSQKGRRISDS